MLRRSGVLLLSEEYSLSLHERSRNVYAMRVMWIALLGLFLYCGAAEAREHCRHQRHCAERQMAKIHNAGGLPPRIIAKIQRKFNGRVVGVRPNGSNCRDIEKEVIIHGKKRIVRDFACRQPDGSWGAPNYNVQVLTGRGNVLIVTVNPRSGKILSVQE